MEYAAIKRKGAFMTIEGENKYTVADIEALPEGERAELIDGEMFMMAAPALVHQDMLMWLGTTIRNYIAEHKGECRVLPAPFAVYIKKDQYNYVEPDISVICDRDKLDNRGCHGAPDWVIEIVSPSGRRMDYVRKLALYSEAGVRLYWIVDPARKNITVYDLGHDGAPEFHSFSDQVSVDIYEEFVIDFSEYLGELEELNQDIE